MLDGFETGTATFFTEEQTGTIEDPYGEDEPVHEWTAAYQGVPVRAEQRDAEYVREAFGEWPMTVYRVYADPMDIGDIVDGEYQLGIDANDRVELSGVTGRFSIEPPNLRRLDTTVPEVVDLEVTRVGD